ncbi:adenylosuccinate lyase [Mollicutes bacterium LVI A0039]|nr:adenylosuccinate lyase [Mollicutes bacterium LVI A0039]
MIERYSTPEMNSIWSEENKYNAWLEVEILACEAFAEMGMIPMEDVQKIRANAKFSVDRILEIEQETRHDVVAFTRSVSESLGEEKKWIHFGLTSTDVVDTAYGYLFRQANEQLETALLTITETIKKLAVEHKYTVQMGRTHGVHAELTTFGNKMALYYAEMQRNVERFAAARKMVEAGKISGAVGTYANIDPKVQDFVCQGLGIESSLISTQTLQRDRHAHYVSTLALIASTIDKMAIELRHLQRTEVREVEEGFKKGQKGSSAMPHKKNPISSENMSGLSRVIRGHMVTAYENIGLWHERDISHSSAERIIMPDSTTLLHYMLRRFNGVLENLNVRSERMKTNISATNNVFFSQKVMLSLIETGMSREAAYDIVQPIAIDCFEREIDFKEAVKPQVVAALGNDKFEACFDINYHMDNIDFVFKRLGLD